MLSIVLIFHRQIRNPELGLPNKYSATQHYNQRQVLFNPICRHHGKFLFLSMLKQWIEVEGHMFLNGEMLNVETHRDGSFFFFFPQMELVFILQWYEDFQSLTGPPKLLKCPLS